MAGTIAITGHLAKDPELETVKVEGEDRSLCRFSVGYSVNRGRNEQNFISVTTWGKAAENHVKWLERGRAVQVGGELAFDPWEARRWYEALSSSRHQRRSGVPAKARLQRPRERGGMWWQDASRSEPEPNQGRTWLEPGPPSPTTFRTCIEHGKGGQPWHPQAKTKN